MLLTIFATTRFAATGRIGQEALEQAVTAGQDLTAGVRSLGGRPSGRVRIVTADRHADDQAGTIGIAR